jgi:hypothetical protein
MFIHRIFVTIQLGLNNYEHTIIDLYRHFCSAINCFFNLANAPG